MNRTAKLLACAAITTVCGCGQPADRVEISETAERSEYRAPGVPNATSEDRFVYESAAPAAPVAAPASATEKPFHYTVPAGWTELAPTQFRNPNFVIGPEQDIECYVSLLPGDGGGLLVNANRWRSQFNATPYTEDEIAALPSVIIMGYPAKILNFVGEFKGMGAAAAIPDYRLIGSIIQTPEALITIKMTGPNEKLMPQLNQFATFVDSLQANDGRSDDAQPASASPIDDNATMPADHPDVSAATSATSAAPSSAGNYTWEVPEGWTKSETGSSMRLITFSAGTRPGQKAECAVFEFEGNGGGRLDNFNRWLGQFDMEPLVETELMLQPTVFFFDEEVPLLVCEGSYGGMGGPKKNDQMLLGASFELEDKSLYIKMTGPRDTVRNNWNKFMLFCASFETKS